MRSSYHVYSTTWAGYEECTVFFSLSLSASLADPVVQEIAKGLLCKVVKKDGELCYSFEINGKERVVSARSALIEMLKKLLGRLVVSTVPYVNLAPSFYITLLLPHLFLPNPFPPICPEVCKSYDSSSPTKAVITSPADFGPEQKKILRWVGWGV